MLGAALGLGVIVCIGMQLWVSSQVTRERERVVQAQAERARLAETVKEIDAYRAEEKSISRKLAIIEQLERSRIGPVRIMDEVATRIPERLWLTSMKLRAGTLRIEGLSLDNETIAAFMTSLEASDYVEAVDLKATRLRLEDGVKLNEFTIEARQQRQPGDLATGTDGAGPPA